MFSQFFNRRLICLGTALSFFLQSSLFTSQAQAQNADQFIAKTHEIAKKVADNSLNSLLLSSFQMALRLAAQLDTEKMVEVVQRQKQILLGYRSDLGKIYARSIDPQALLSGAQLTQLYKDYLKTASDIAKQTLTIEGIRTDSYAYQSQVFKVADQFLNNLEGTCVNGLHMSPYSEVAPILKAIMPEFEIKVAGSISGDGFQLKPDSSSVMLFGSDQEKMISAGVFLGSVMLSTYALTGTWVLSQTAFQSLALNTQMAALGMGLGITAAIAVVVLAVQTAEARAKSEEYVREQRKIFENRANHNTVNQLFTTKCNEVKNSLSSLRKDLKSLAEGKATAIALFNSDKNVQLNRIQQVTNTLSAYQKQSLEILKSDFNNQPDNIKAERQKALSETPEAKAFLEQSEKLSPVEMADMIRFLMRAFYQDGIKHAEAVEKEYQEIITLISKDSMKNRATVLRKLASKQNIFEFEVRTKSNLNLVLQNAPKIAEIYAELDQIVFDIGAQIMDTMGNAFVWDEIEHRIIIFQNKVRELLAQDPRDEILQHIEQHLREIQTLMAKSGSF